jgi:hypothetical protein
VPSPGVPEHGVDIDGDVGDVAADDRLVGHVIHGQVDR